MKFGTGSNAERTQKYGGSKYKMTYMYVRPNIYTNKQTSPIFNCVTPVSVSLANARSPITFFFFFFLFFFYCFQLLILWQSNFLTTLKLTDLHKL